MGWACAPGYVGGDQRCAVSKRRRGARQLGHPKRCRESGRQRGVTGRVYRRSSDLVTLNAAENRDGSAGLLGGFTGGYDGWENGAASGSAATCASGVLVNGQCKRLYKSTEHNIDLYSMFSRLYMADGQARWAAAARQAKHFFLSMWDPQEGKYWTGTTEDGVTVSTDVIPVDIQAWAVQVLGAEAQPYLSALAYVEANHKTSLGYGFKQDGGNSCGDYTWFEGTSQVAVAYFLSGNKPMWQSILNGVHSVQSTAGSMPATDGPCLNTGFTLNDGSPWEYFPRAAMLKYRVYLERWQPMGVLPAGPCGRHWLARASGKRC